MPWWLDVGVMPVPPAYAKKPWTQTHTAPPGGPSVAEVGLEMSGLEAGPHLVEAGRAQESSPPELVTQGLKLSQMSAPQKLGQESV